VTPYFLFAHRFFCAAAILARPSALTFLRFRVARLDWHRCIREGDELIVHSMDRLLPIKLTSHHSPVTLDQATPRLP